MSEYATLIWNTPLTTAQSVVMVARYSYNAMVNPGEQTQTGRVDHVSSEWVVHESSRWGRRAVRGQGESDDEPYIFFSLSIKTNGSSTSQWKCTSGLHNFD